MKKQKRKLKVFSLPWHTGHQYELLKLDFDWHYLIQHTRKWGSSSRPQPDHLKWVPYYEPGKYDFALLHIDQQCLLPRLGKSIVYREIRSQIKDIPVIVINHGTPTYPEIFMQKAEEEGMAPTEDNAMIYGREEMKKVLSDVDQVVVNSHQAAKEWDLGKAIIHGMDVDEWKDLPKEVKIVTSISPAGMGEVYYGRNFYRETRDILSKEYGINAMWVGEQSFAPSWEHYKGYIGRALIYFNPTIGSPMPRARTEAMLSGCCVVTTKFHDADKFIEHGKNGFLVDVNPVQAAKLLAELVSDYKRAIKVGQEGKKTAIKLFSGERFRQEWRDLIESVLNKNERKIR